MRLLGRLVLLLAGITLAVVGVRALLPPAPLADRISALEATGAATVGDFEVAMTGSHRRDARLEVRPTDDPDRLAFASVPGAAFVGAAEIATTFDESLGHVTYEERPRRRLPHQTVTDVVTGPDALHVHGHLHGDGETAYTLSVTAAGAGRLRVAVELDDDTLDRTVVALAADPDAATLGLGEQFTHLDVTGRRVPVLTREQGIGRGAQPLTLGADLTAGAGGDWSWTYSAVPLAISTDGTATLVEDTAVAWIDRRARGRTVVEVRGDAATLQLVDGPEPATLLARTTEVTGRMRPLPAWVDDGLILGVQGGTARVREIVERVEDAGVPLAGVWLQDWVGQRTTSFGQRLWWSWTRDRTHYPDWEALVDDLDDRGVAVLTYVNPFLTPGVPEGQDDRRDLFAEAAAAGHLVEHPDGGPYLQDQGEFEAALVDLSDPDARAWLRDVLVEEVAGAGATGWMADFGEALPFDAVLHDGDPDDWHNHYPVAWAELNREALDAAGLGEDGLAFHRAGALRSPAHATLFWLGDQTVDDTDQDGLGSAVTGLLSGGLSGWTLNHADTGGYTAVQTPVFSVVRDRELLDRWFELSAFTVALRTHEGNLPDANHQVYDDADTLAHAARMTRLYRALAPLRRELVAEAASTGMPPVRQGWLVVPDDPRAPGWDRQLFLGDDLLVAPVTTLGAETVRVDVPEGEWVHPWSGERIRGGHDVTVRLHAPVGWPAVLHRAGSPVAELLDAAGLGTPPGDAPGHGRVR